MFQKNLFSIPYSETQVGYKRFVPDKLVHLTYSFDSLVSVLALLRIELAITVLVEELGEDEVFVANIAVVVEVKTDVRHPLGLTHG
jgi:hypothetical protein